MERAREDAEGLFGIFFPLTASTTLGAIVLVVGDLVLGWGTAAVLGVPVLIVAGGAAAAVAGESARTRTLLRRELAIRSIEATTDEVRAVLAEHGPSGVGSGMLWEALGGKPPKGPSITACGKLLEVETPYHRTQTLDALAEANRAARRRWRIALPLVVLGYAALGPWVWMLVRFGGMDLPTLFGAVPVPIFWAIGLFIALVWEGSDAVCDRARGVVPEENRARAVADICAEPWALAIGPAKGGGLDPGDLSTILNTLGANSDAIEAVVERCRAGAPTPAVLAPAEPLQSPSDRIRPTAPSRAASPVVHEHELAVVLGCGRAPTVEDIHMLAAAGSIVGPYAVEAVMVEGWATEKEAQERGFAVLREVARKQGRTIDWRQWKGTHLTVPPHNHRYMVVVPKD